MLNMDRKGGTVLLLLMCCTVLATSVKIKSNSKITETARQLMKKCKQMGYEQPDIDQLATVMGSDVPAEERNPDRPTTSLLSMFADALQSVSFDSPSSKLLNSLGKKGSRRFNTTTFTKMIQKLSNLSNASRCFLGAVMAPVSWDAITNGENSDMDPEEFEQYVWAAKQVMESPPRRLGLPKNISVQNMRILMKMLRKKYSAMSKEQRKEVMKWVKKQIMSNCRTSRAAPNSEKCVRWVTRATMNMLGPYISYLSAADIELSPRKAMCEFFTSDQFEPIMDRLNPSRGKKLVNKIKDCANFTRFLDRLGRLVCYFNPQTTKLTLDENMTLLSKITQCPGLARLKKRLMASITRKTKPEIMQKLGSAVKFIPKEELARLSKDDVVAVLNNTGVNFTKKQKRVLCRTYLGDTKCRELSKKEINDLRPALQALPPCIWKKTMNKQKDNPEILGYMSQNIGKSQAVAMVNVLTEKNTIEEMGKFPSNILQAVPMKIVRKAKVTSWEMIVTMKWRCAPAIYLVKKLMKTFKYWYRNPGSLICGVTCKMIENTDARDVQEMSEGLADISHMLSKNQARCAAHKIFATRELQRSDYFKTVTPEELSTLPTVFLIHLPPEKIMALPQSVCPEFLKMMKEADFRTLSVRSPSRTALRNKALKCLGSDLSALSSEDMDLGPLLCEVPPATLRLLKPEVRSLCLQDLAKCDFIPEKHRKGVAQLANEMLGHPDNWTDTAVEEMGPLLFLDENTERPPLKTALKDSVSFVLQRLQKHVNCVCNFLKELLFKLTLLEYKSESSAAVIRRRREVDPNYNRKRKPEGNSNNTTNSTFELTPELITELGEQNNKWKPQQLEDMSLDTFKETVEILGNVTSYSKLQLDALREKAVMAWGKPQSMNESVVTELGCIAQGFKADELMMMELSQSSLADIAPCGWSDMQILAVWKGAANYNNLTAENLDASDLVEIDRFICGLNSTEIQQLNTTAFTDAVASINEVQCSAEVLQHFRNLTVDAFGAPSSWTEEEVSEIGTFVAALDAKGLASLDVSVFSYFSQKSIPLILPPNLAALSVAQLEAFGPDNAAQVTDKQKAHMTPEQLGALDRASQGLREQNQQGNQQNSSSQAAERMAMSTKLLVSILVGLMLL